MDYPSNTKRPCPYMLPYEPPKKRLKPANESAEIDDVSRNHRSRAWSTDAVDPLHLDHLCWLDLAVTPRAATTYQDGSPQNRRDDSFIGINFTIDPGILHGESSDLDRISQVALRRQIRAADTLMRERIRIQRFAVARGLRPPIRVGSHVSGSSNIGRLTVRVRRFGQAENPKRVLKRLMYGSGA